MAKITAIFKNLKLIPLIMQYIDILLPLIKLVETVLGPNTGPEKKARVRAAAIAALRSVAEADLPIDDKTERLIDAMIDFIVLRLNASGGVNSGDDDGGSADNPIIPSIYGQPSSHPIPDDAELLGQGYKVGDQVVSTLEFWSVLPAGMSRAGQQLARIIGEGT